MDEIFKKVERPNLKHEYFVSNMGRVARKNSDGSFRFLYQSKNNKNVSRAYLVTRLIFTRNKQTIRVHRLVADCFVENPQNKPQVNHKDGNKFNNQASNLEWVTRSENIRHSIDILGNRHSKIGENAANRKITLDDTRLLIKFVKNGVLSRKEAAKFFGLSHSRCISICSDVPDLFID